MNKDHLHTIWIKIELFLIEFSISCFGPGFQLDFFAEENYIKLPLHSLDHSSHDTAFGPLPRPAGKRAGESRDGHPRQI